MNDDYGEPEVTLEQNNVTITLPQFKKWSTSQFYDYTNSIADYNTIEELNETIKKARTALFKLTETINKYEREEREAKTAYDRAWKREYLASAEKTEAAKKARADLRCEGLENTWITYDQLKSELIRLSHSLRLELQTLQTVGNNLRRQLE